MAEILGALGGALSEHGVEIEESVDRFPALADDLVHLFVPHEYQPVVDNGERQRAESPHFFSGARKWELMADSKVILNVHRDDFPYLEWHRVIGAILNGCVVVSEPSLGAEPLVAGEHFVEAELDELPRALDELLDDPARLARIRDAAYDLVLERLPTSATATSLLSAIEQVAANRLPGAAQN